MVIDYLQSNRRTVIQTGIGMLVAETYRDLACPGAADQSVPGPTKPLLAHAPPSSRCFIQTETNKSEGVREHVRSSVAGACLQGHQDSSRIFICSVNVDD